MFVTGAVPLVSVVLRPASGGTVNLVGQLKSELRRLAGATVAVEGIRKGAGAAAELDVRGYEVLLVDGQEPRVGVLADTGGAMRLLGKDTVELSPVPQAMRGQAGFKVWVVGTEVAGKLQVQSYGVIREGER